jgi:hypothetical protein
MTAVAQAPEVLVTGLGSKIAVPGWARRYSPRVASETEIGALDELAPLTVVQAGAPEVILRHRKFLEALSAQQKTTPEPAKIVFVFESKAQLADAAQRLAKLLARFPRPADVQFAGGAHQAAFAFQEAWAKVMVDLETAKSAAPADALAGLRKIIAATADLRTEDGRLSAERVADAFGLSTAELAGLLGRSRQAVGKTPSAESLQPGLLPFERVARLRAILDSSDFRRWLNMPNIELDGRTPLALIRAGKTDVVADLTEDMLTGSPA